MSKNKNNDVVLFAEGVRRSFRMGRAEIEVLDGLGLTLRRGDKVSVVGSSGSGKTTMINVLGLLDRPQRGRVELLGQDALAASRKRRNALRNRGIGFVFQFYHLVHELTAAENVWLPAMIGGNWLGRRADIKRRAAELLERVGLEDRAKHRPQELSGGERQRVAIARALINRPAVLFCDEPTGNLDPRTSQGVQELLLGLDSADRAMLLVTHDERLAARTGRVYRLSEGKLEADPALGGAA